MTFSLPVPPSQFPSTAGASPMSVVPQGVSPSAVTEAWLNLQPQLESSVGSADYAAWLAPLKIVNIAGTRLTLSAPTAFIVQWVEKHYVTQLQAMLESATGMALQIGLQVAPQFSHSQPSSSFGQNFTPGFGAAQPQAAPSITGGPAMLPEAPSESANLPEWLTGSRLDNRYTFEQFVTGKSNQFAFAAAQGVAKAVQDGHPAFNPFFLHGGVGLGKTHLMHAIGHAVTAVKPNTTILYLSSEQFLYKFIRALKDKNTLAFKEIFRGVDILMIDDIQFIAGKDATQEEFFHTFNTLVQEGKQIVLTADRSPHELPNLEDRLKSRLGSGLTIEVHAPEEETRLAILQAKAESLNFEMSPAVLQLLAQHIASNVRELEGALNRLVAYARLTGEALTPDLAREQLRDLFRVYTRVITIDDIQQKVATQFNIRVADMHSPRRAREVARPRQVAMYLSKQLTNRSYPDIGRAFGGRDHTTVIHACETINSLIPRDSQLAEQIEMVTRTLQGR
ncbi:MAG: chromosomal replication initiator protein DnaA [Pseudomonas fluorescens]|nr:MAG: chromosomal replication initiator protein DnaA [Pseudomonas fluorescens]